MTSGSAASVKRPCHATEKFAPAPSARSVTSSIFLRQSDHSACAFDFPFSSKAETNQAVQATTRLEDGPPTASTVGRAVRCG
jgi:hypothetical protein